MGKDYVLRSLRLCRMDRWTVGIGPGRKSTTAGPSKVSGSRRIRTRRGTMVLNWWVHDLSPFPLSLVINHCIKILALLFLGTKVVAGGDGLCCAYLGDGKLNITCMRFPLQLLPRPRSCALLNRFPFHRM